MLKTNRTNHVYTAIQLNEKGFTFLSVLLAITVVFLTLPLIALITKSIDYSSNYDAMSVQQFFYFLRDDVIASTMVESEQSDKLILHYYDDTIVTFEKYDDLIRRQVNGQGHEIYLREVQDVQFTASPNTIHVFITMKQGDQYEKSIHVYQ
ncbi:competence type IV pilus minor pilin ComGF [Virgibacillus siamensis]|uniref:competence type IV pilus minor pilin ComGF n=1 Tax=Virgibacillus siamensis TaxID=480071 RepID=UPI000985BCE8|nr:competence type IV pilus minor pilin ComGF [Virgibacillus siamensis]